MAFDKTRYDNAYKRKMYDRVIFLIPKGKRKILQQIANARGVSVSRVVIDGLEKAYDIDLGK